MRRIDYLARDARTLADFLDLMQSDGLQAKGCSFYLLLPGETTWGEWLENDNPDEDAWDIAALIDEMRRAVDAAAMKTKEQEDDNDGRRIDAAVPTAAD